MLKLHNHGPYADNLFSTSYLVNDELCHPAAKVAAQVLSISRSNQVSTNLHPSLTLVHLFEMLKMERGGGQEGIEIKRGDKKKKQAMSLQKSTEAYRRKWNCFPAFESTLHGHEIAIRPKRGNIHHLRTL